MKNKALKCLTCICTVGIMLAGCGTPKEIKEATAAASDDAMQQFGEELEKQELDNAETDTAKVSSRKSTEDQTKTVAILVPEGEGTLWVEDGKELNSAIISRGFDTVVEEAASASQQSQQILNHLEDASAYVILPIDPYGLTDALSEAGKAGIPVVSYSDLIMNSPYVSYYVTFDYRKMGNEVGKDIIDAADLDTLQDQGEVRSIELLAGSKDNIDALFFFNGVMESLQPYFDSQTLVAVSGYTSFEDTAIMDDDADAAKRRIRQIFDDSYEGGYPQIICTGFGGAALAVSEVLRDEGYASDGGWPIITGTGYDLESVRSIVSGQQRCSTYMDRAMLADVCATLLSADLQGKDVEINDYKQYDNGIRLIKTYALSAELINSDNYQLLVDQGVVDAADIAEISVNQDAEPTEAAAEPTEGAPEPANTPEVTDTPEATDNTPETTEAPEAGEEPATTEEPAQPADTSQTSEEAGPTDTPAPTETPEAAGPRPQ